jgi:hypothetical protein
MRILPTPLFFIFLQSICWYSIFGLVNWEVAQELGVAHLPRVHPIDCRDCHLRSRTGGTGSGCAVAAVAESAKASVIVNFMAA